MSVAAPAAAGLAGAAGAKPARRSALGRVLLAAGAVGFFVGAVGYVDWQAAVESAQVLAGLVRYPDDNPFFVYHTQLWTLLNQLLAPLLRLGLSEGAASLLVSGALGMLSLQALAAVVFALCRDPLVAVGGAIAVFFCRANEYGVAYPVWFAGTSHTYGIAGLSHLVLVLGLLGGGWLRAGGFLLGLAPAVHPALGLLLGLVVACSLAPDARVLRARWGPALRPFLLGGALTTASLLLQQLVIRRVPAGAEAVPPELGLAFLTLWDFHRQPVPWDHPGVLFNVAVLGAALFWLARRRDAFPGTSVLLPRAAAAGAALGLLSLTLYFVPPDLVPAPLFALMPTRVLNVAIVLSLPLLIGLVARERGRPGAQGLLLALLAALLVGGGAWPDAELPAPSRLWQIFGLLRIDVRGVMGVMPHPWAIMAAAAAGLAALTRRGAGGPADATARATAAARWRAAGLGVLGIVAALTLGLALLRHQERGAVLEDWRDNAVLAAAARGEGLLLTGGDLHLVQLRTRRPVLIDGGGLDGIFYARGTLPAMADIVTNVYRVDFFDPPPEGRRRGAVPAEISLAAWEAMPPQFWEEVRSRYGVTEVLTEAGSPLNLPLVARDERLALYRIPAPGAP